MTRDSDLSALQAQSRADAAAKSATQHAWHPDPASWEPAWLFNGMIAPETAFTMKGVIWYQGESNTAAALAPMYSKLFPALISDWRAKWGQGNFPFLFVQISSYKSNPTDLWGVVRDAQRRTLDLTGTGMAVSLDVGDPNNIHPPDKQSVSHRLALAARALAYGESIEYSGPLFRQATSEGASLRVWFNHSDGLTARGATLEGFEVAGQDHHFEPAVAHIDGATVVVNAAEIKTPVYVRYAWANAPAANLYNGAELPASTFTSEETPKEP
jgi:sialate O-acetylesterase